jgi:hypothetical protein
MRFWKDNSGATAVEFALVVGPLLLLLFGTFEFGRLIWTRESLESTAIAGARCVGVKIPACAPGGTVSRDSTIAYVRNYARDFHVVLPQTAVAMNTDATCGGSSGFAEIEITYTFRSAVGPFLEALGAGVEIKASACFPNQTV